MHSAPATFSAHLPFGVVRQLFEDSIGYVPDAATEAKYADRVDEDRGIVFGVKLLGLESRNTPRTIGETYESVGEYLDVPYCYSLDALRDAVPLFEGIKVLIDHPDFQYTRAGERFAPPKDRSVKEGFGRIVNVRVTSDGMYGDHEYLKSEPFSAKYVEVARRMPNVLAFSPAANGVLRVVNAKPTIIKITDVRSVDLVGERPGTTSSLFESESRRMADTAVTDPEKKLAEDDAPPLTTGGDAAMVEDVPADTAAAPAADHFDAAFEKEVMDIWSGEGTPQEKASKIAKLAKQQEQIQGIRGTASDDDEDDDLSLEETADPAAAASSAAVGKAEIAPTGKAVAEAAACDTAMDDKKVHESAAYQALAAKHARVVKKFKALEASVEQRETAIFESIDLLNAQGKPVRSSTVKVVSREPDKKARERFIAESVAARVMPAPKSQAAATAPGAARPLHETTAQAAQPANSKLQEAIAKGDGAAIAEMLRSGVAA